MDKASIMQAAWAEVRDRLRYVRKPSRAQVQEALKYSLRGAWQRAKINHQIKLQREREEASLAAIPQDSLDHQVLIKERVGEFDDRWLELRAEQRRRAAA